MKKLLLTPFLIVLFAMNFSQAKNNLVIYDPVQQKLNAFTTSGSSLCEDFNLIYNLPDSLQTHYDIEFRFVANETSNTGEVLYIATKTDTEKHTQSITSDLTEHFLPINYEDSVNTWTFNFSVQIDGEIEVLGSTYAYPYTACVNLTYDCDSIVVTEKKLLQATTCGTPNSGNTFEYEITNDSIIISKQVTRIVPAVCEIYDTHIREQSISITDFEAKKYTVEFNYLISLTPPLYPYDSIMYCTCPPYVKDSMITYPLPITLPDVVYIAIQIPETFLGNADMRDCIINSLDDIEVAKHQIYPNPANDKVYIDGFSGELKLTNQLGQSYLLNDNYSVEDLPKGIYLATYEVDGNLIQSKLIVE